MAPVAKNTQFRYTPPKITSKGNSIVVTHFERVATITGSVQTATTTFAVNPGLVSSFPWLAAIARRYETYSFSALQYEYKSKCSTLVAGNVVIAPDYDPLDTPPVNSTQAESLQDARNTQPWRDVIMKCDAANLHKQKSFYTRAGGIPAGASLINYDPCNVSVLTEGQADGAVIGILYARYTVTLTTPQFGSEVETLLGGTLKTTGTPVVTGPFINGTLLAPSGGILLGSLTGIVTLQFPGTYLVSFNSTSGGTFNTANSLINTVGCTVTQLNESTSAVAKMNTSFAVVCTAPNATFLPVISGAQPLTSCEMNIAVALPGSLLP